MFFIRFRSEDSDESYEAAEHEFPTAMGEPVVTGLSQGEYEQLNNKYLKQAAELRRELQQRELAQAREPELA